MTPETAPRTSFPKIAHCREEISIYSELVEPHLSRSPSLNKSRLLLFRIFLPSLFLVKENKCRLIINNWLKNNVTKSPDLNSRRTQRKKKKRKKQDPKNLGVKVYFSGKDGVERERPSGHKTTGRACPVVSATGE